MYTYKDILLQNLSPMTQRPKQKTIEELKTQTDEICAQLESLKDSAEDGDKQKKKELEAQLSDLWKEVKEKLDSWTLTTQERRTLESLKSDLNPYAELTSLQGEVRLSSAWAESLENPENFQENENHEHNENSHRASHWMETQSPTENTATSDSTPIDEEKSWIWKSWDWTKEQWQDVWDKEKWSTDTWLNILRTAWFAATWIWAAALIYKGIKKLFGSDEKEEEVDEKPKKKKKKESDSDDDKEMPWWKKGLLRAWWIVGAGALWTVVYKNWNRIKAWFWEKIGNNLDIKEATEYASSQVKAWLMEESPFRYNFDGIEYDENKKTIKSYGCETQIDVEKKIIVWMNGVVFPNNEELVHAANIINFAKKSFHHRCESDQPFSRTTWGWWDLQVKLADGREPEWVSASDSDTWARIGWVAGWVLWVSLWWYIWWVGWAVWLGATLWLAWAAVGNAIDNDSSMGNATGTVASWNNFKKFILYLNKQKDSEWNSLWEYRADKIDSESPIQDEAKEILNELESIYSEDGMDIERDLDVKQDVQDPTKFTVESYWEKVPLILEWCEIWSDGKIDYSKIKGVKIGKYNKKDRWDWLEIDFSHTRDWVKEAIKVANITNKIRKDFHNRWWESYPFGCKLYWMNQYIIWGDEEMLLKEMI